MGRFAIGNRSLAVAARLPLRLLDRFRFGLRARFRDRLPFVQRGQLPSRARKQAVLLLAIALTAAGSEPRLVWSAANTNLLGGPSQDGRFLSFVDTATGDLALLEVATGKSRRLTTNTPGSGQFAYFSSISPDGKRIAYAWFNEEKFYDLRVLNIDSDAEPVTLFRNEEAGFVQPCAWSPDGRQILTLLFRKDNISQIALVTAVTPSQTRVLKSLAWVYPNKMDFSPDGRLVVYDNPAGAEAAQRDIFALRVDGGGETRLVADPANDIFPVWTADGKAILFASDRGGGAGIWRQAVEGGKPAGAAVPVKANAGRVLSLGMTRNGEYFYGRRAGSTDVQVAKIDLAKDKVAEPPKRATIGFAGMTSAPAWSSDGKRLAFLVRLANENFGQESRGIGIVEGGRERLLTPKLAHIERVQWSTDGASLLASGSDRQNRSGLYRVDAATGEVTPLVQHRASSYRGLDGVWTPKEQSLLYVYQSEIRERLPGDGTETVVYRADAGARLSHLALSPAGRWLSFVAAFGKPGGREEVCVMDWKKGEARTIASLQQGGVLGLEWAPDSTSVLVTTPGSAGPILWRASLDGGQPQRLSIALERVDGIRLHPDGRQAAFTTGGVHAEVWVMPVRP